MNAGNVISWFTKPLLSNGSHLVWRYAAYFIHIPLPPKIDPSVTMMTVEEKPDVTYNDVGGSKEVMEKLREVVELPLLHPEKFVQLGIDPPKGVLCYGPPGTGKTLLARAVANRTDACFIRVIGGAGTPSPGS